MPADRPNPLRGQGSEGVRRTFSINPSITPDPLFGRIVGGLTLPYPFGAADRHPELPAPPGPTGRTRGHSGAGHHTGTTIELFREAGCAAP
ncbi:hypothetical protein GCM10010343_42760 [Streptomyces avidinii]|nr:hypothetical protein GCM10010343_42760 [Streptomyces avidinii]